MNTKKQVAAEERRGGGMDEEMKEYRSEEKDEMVALKKEGSCECDCNC